MAHTHSVKDKDLRFVIDPITKAVKNTSKKVVIAQYSHNAEQITFEIDRYVEGHDMSLCTEAQIHFQNLDVKTREQNSDVYTSKDLQIDPENPEKVICTWLISNACTQFAGLLNFAVWYVCKEDDIITYAFPALVFKNLEVGESLYSSEKVLEENIDIIEQWKSDVMRKFTDDITAWEAATAISVKAEVKAELSQEIDVERKRINSFVALKDGSTTGDAELMDIRIGADGKEYESAGDAVRGQIANQRQTFDKCICFENSVQLLDVKAILKDKILDTNDKSVYSVADLEGGYLLPLIYTGETKDTTFATNISTTQTAKFIYTYYIDSVGDLVRGYRVELEEGEKYNTFTIPGSNPAFQIYFTVSYQDIDTLYICKESEWKENISLEYYKERPKFSGRINAENILGFSDLAEVVEMKANINEVSDDISEIQKKLTDDLSDNPTKYSGTEVNVFASGVAIGDSLTQGTLDYMVNGERKYIVDANRAYPAIFTRKTGIPLANKGAGGLSSVGWYNAYKNTNLTGYDFAVVALGVNDYTQEVATSDSETAIEAIIAKLKSENNGIKIFLCTMMPRWNISVLGNAYNEMVRSVCANNDSVYLLDMDLYSAMKKDNSCYIQGHLTGFGYERYANEIIAYISKIIHDTPNDFKNVHFTGTEYTY